MKNIGIKNIKKSFYKGYVYNLHLKSNRNDEKDDLFFIEKDSGVISHNCFPKDLNAFIVWGKSLGLDMTMFDATNEVNDRVREYRDWENIVGATSKNNYK